MNSDRGNAQKTELELIDNDAVFTLVSPLWNKYGTRQQLINKYDIASWLFGGKLKENTFLLKMLLFWAKSLPIRILTLLPHLWHKVLTHRKNGVNELPKWSWYSFLLYVAVNFICYGSYGTFGISIVFLAARPGS